MLKDLAKYVLLWPKLWSGWIDIPQGFLFPDGNGEGGGYGSINNGDGEGVPSEDQQLEYGIADPYYGYGAGQGAHLNGNGVTD